LRIVAALSVKVFDPPIFAALCSPDLNAALKRIATYKRLVCPKALHVEIGTKATTMELEWLDASMLLVARHSFYLARDERSTNKLMGWATFSMLGAR
jgi:hypothetical protein